MTSTTAFHPVNKAEHYNSHPSGVEAKEIIRHLGFALGSVFKYVFRRDRKEPLRSLQSAQFWLQDYSDHPTLPPNIDGLYALYLRVLQAETNPHALMFYRLFWDYMANQNTNTFAACQGALEQLVLLYTYADKASRGEQ